MVITRHGDGCFKVQTGGVSIVVDAPDARLKPDISLKTTIPTPLPYGENSHAEILGPGEYDIRGVEIRGFPFGKNGASENGKSTNGSALRTAYLLRAEDMNLVFLGNPGREIGFTLEGELGSVDILFAPPGSAKFVKQLGPKIVVSAYFPSAVAAGKEFEQKIKEEERLTIKKKEVPAAGTTFVALHA